MVGVTLKWHYVSRALPALDSSSVRIPVGSPLVEGSHDNDMINYSDVIDEN